MTAVVERAPTATKTRAPASSRTPLGAVRRFGELSAQDLQDWRGLEAAQPNANPFLTPTWVGAWYDNRVAPDDQAVVLVRTGGEGPLVGVAPMYRSEVRVGPVRLAQRLIPVGAGVGSALELPGHLSAPGVARDVNRAIIAATAADRSDWANLVLAPEQGWLEPEHLMEAGGASSFWQHLRPRACVVLRLGATWDETAAGFKRNLKEGLRRSRNRIAKLESHRLRHRTGDDLDEASVLRLLDLHRARADKAGGGIEHGDAFARPLERSLVLAALPRLAREDRASIFELEVAGRVVASQLVLHGPRSSYIHSSGFAAEAWDLGPVTYLVGAAVRHAVERGDTLVNYSPGPRVGKLRWSEDLWVSNEFAFGVGTKAQTRRYNLMRSAAALDPSIVGLNRMEPSATA